MTRVLELSAQAAGGVRAHIRQVSQLLAKDGHQVLLAGPSNVISPAPDAVGGACPRTYQIDIGARPSGAKTAGRHRRGNSRPRPARGSFSGAGR